MTPLLGRREFVAGTALGTVFLLLFILNLYDLWLRKLPQEA